LWSKRGRKRAIPAHSDQKSKKTIKNRAFRLAYLTKTVSYRPWRVENVVCTSQKGHFGLSGGRAFSQSV